MTSAIDRGRPVDIIFLDFPKAFDKVPHNRLLLKLYSFGIHGNLLRWIQEWLHGREQRVVVNGCSSVSREEYYQWCSTGISSWALTFSGIHSVFVFLPKN